MVHKLETGEAYGGTGWRCTACDWRGSDALTEYGAAKAFRAYHEKVHTEEVESDYESTISQLLRQLTKQREENRQLRALIHTLTREV